MIDIFHIAMCTESPGADRYASTSEGLRGYDEWKCAEPDVDDYLTPEREEFLIKRARELRSGNEPKLVKAVCPRCLGDYWKDPLRRCSNCCKGVVWVEEKQEDSKKEGEAA